MAISVDGVEQFYFSGTATIPDDPSFGGYTIYAHDESFGTDHTHDEVLGSWGPNDVTWKSQPRPIDSRVWDLYAVSYDTNGNLNTLLPGTTPRVTALQAVPQTSGSIKANRIDPSTLDGTVHVSAGFFGVNQINVAQFASGIMPILLEASDPTLPNALYPAGTIEYNTTSQSLKKVNAAGTAWIAMVNAGTDVVANTITAGQMAAGAIGTAQLFAGQIKVGGGAGMPSQFEVVDGSGSPIGWIGTDSGNVGAWFKTCRVGGTAYSNAPFQADASGNTSWSFASGASTVNIDATNFIKVSNSSNNQVIQLDPVNGFKVYDTANSWSVVVQADNLNISNSSGHSVAVLTSLLGGGRLYLGDSSGAQAFVVDASSAYTATSATAGSQTLPSNPDGFLIVQIGSATKKIPYYVN
jgi:hypothetical protein